MEWNVFCNNIKEKLNLESLAKHEVLEYEINEKKIEINYFIHDGRKINYKYTKYKFSKDFYDKTVDDNFFVYDEKYYEVPISIKNESIPTYYVIDKITDHEYEDTENGIYYDIGKPSKIFFYKILDSDIKSTGVGRMGRIGFYYRDLKYNEVGIVERDLFELLEIVYRNMITLKISSRKSKQLSDFQNLIESFIFNINYNTDIGITQLYDYDNYNKRLDNKFRDEDIEKIAAPQKIYKKELVDQYNMASVSQDPFIKYICYYHILEHFYENVYKEELVNIIKKQLTRPSFSIKKDKELLELADVVRKKMNFDRENFDGSELEALELVLEKYINIDNLKKSLKEHDTSIIQYYDKNSVNFSGGNQLNFNDTKNIFKNIAKRIYITRNALVHYKSNDLSIKEKGIYKPFHDRKDLQKEIPLIRVLAEEVIIAETEII